MTVGILGLGLVGGSLARAYTKAGYNVLAAEKDASILSFAQLAGVVHDELNCNNIGSCDLILLAIYTEASTIWLEKNAQHITKNTLVLDCCGLKGEICRRCFPLADKYGFVFVGGHPMAGSHNSGFKYSRSNLFQGAPMVIVPPRYDDPDLLERVKDALGPCGFKSINVTTADSHDRLIAFTSQMPHLISNAFIKSPTALSHKGVSAGSYKDMTRVAWLNPQMWAELFLSNKENLLNELDHYINSLAAYRTALADENYDEMVMLLDEGRKRKKEVDG